MRTRHLYQALASMLLCLSLACGGGSSAPPPPPVHATGLVYIDPTGTGWRLLKDPASTSTKLVLNLVGPAGLKTRGVGFNLQAPVSIHFDTFGNGLALADLGVYQLQRAGSVDPMEPVALVGGIKSSNVLTAGIFQKDRIQSAQDSGAALCQLAIVFDGGKDLYAGQSLSLQITKARVIPEDIGAITDDFATLTQKMKMADITIALGRLSTK